MKEERKAAVQMGVVIGAGMAVGRIAQEPLANLLGKWPAVFIAGALAGLAAVLAHWIAGRILKPAE